MRYGSVCSGIEAATVAWHPLGWRPSFFSDIEAFPRAVLRHHYPTVPLHGAFTTIQAGDYEPIDLLVGGTPCQPFSVAGLRGGLADERGNLALEYLRLAQRLRPRWLVWENVPGVLSSNGGRDFGSILGGLVELGYGFAYRVLDAQFFGVPQRRRRVFVVGYLGDWRAAAAVLFERHSLQGHPAPRREAGARVAQALTRSLGAGGPDDNRAQANHFIETALAFGGNNTTGPIDVATALNAHCGPHWRMDFESETFVATTLRARDGAKGVDSDCTDTLIPISFDWQGGGKQTSLGASVDGTGALGTTKTPAVACVTGDVAHTLKAEGFDASEDGTGRGQPMVNQGAAVRRLTPRECERLQGFPDDYTLIPVPKRNRHGNITRCPLAADGPRYKALGNSMAVPVMAWIGRRIEAVERCISESPERNVGSTA